MARAVAVVAAVLLLGGCAPGETGPAASGSPAAGAPATSVTVTPTATPDAAPTGAAPSTPPPVPRSDASLGAAAVAPVVPPVRVEVPDLGIDVSVAAEGVDGDGALALPEDPDVASWYRWGESPWSEKGATVIASHVDSLEYGLGQFARLTDAVAGTRVQVEAADGRVADYVVQRVDMLQKTAVDWAGIFVRTGPPTLVLITCGGEFDRSTGHYLSNVVVTAVPAG